MTTKNSSQQVANLLEEMVTVRLEELIKSEWFQMLVEQTVSKVLREQQEFQELTTKVSELLAEDELFLNKE
jgi:tRNA(Phe) wybutosine-synthesizing methylase Tyw3|tara:strand:+ start:260 stop:472 length:213 start_codon:yes stop_codon:yes gene_type:complete